MTGTLFSVLKTMGFEGTGSRYRQNDLIGGSVLIVVLDGQWTEIDFERGEVLVNKRFGTDCEALGYIGSLLSTGKIEAFSSDPEERP